MKQRHMEHHFLDETGNFGITNYFWDRVLGTYYDRRERPEQEPRRCSTSATRPRSPSAIRGWSELSGGVASGHPRKRATAAERRAPRNAG